MADRVARRAFIRRLALAGAALPAASGLLAACSAAPAKAPAPAGTAPVQSAGASQPPAPAAPAAPAAPPTSAPASAAKPAGLGRTDLVVGWGGDFVSLDPAQMRDTLDTELGYKLYSSLVRIKTGTVDELVPDLATSWEVSPDGLEYTFHLRPDAKWHKGLGQVTAEDVKFSLLRHKDKDVGSLYRAESAAFKDVQVVDPSTVKLILSAPYPGFLLEFAAYRPGFIVNKQAMDEAGKRYNEQPVGSGPYIMQKWSPKEKVEVSRFDGYYGQKGPFTKVTYNEIIEEATLEIALEKGDIDMAYFFNPEIQNRIVGNSKLTAKSTTGPRTYYLQLNFEHPPFDDVRVRQALWYAIDKQALVSGVMSGQGTPTDTLLNPMIPGRLDEVAYKFDPAKAKQLLAEAGHAGGIKTSLLIYDGELISPLGAAIQAMWKDVGVDAELDQREWPQHVDIRRAGTFDLALQPQLRLGADQYFSPLLHSASAPYPNASRYKSAEMDGLIDKARTTVDDKARFDLSAQIQRLVWKDVPVIPLVHPVFVLASRPEIKGAVPGLTTLNLTELTI